MPGSFISTHTGKQSSKKFYGYIPYFPYRFIQLFRIIITYTCLFIPSKQSWLSLSAFYPILYRVFILQIELLQDLTEYCRYFYSMGLKFVFQETSLAFEMVYQKAIKRPQNVLISSYLNGSPELQRTKLIQIFNDETDDKIVPDWTVPSQYNDGINECINHKTSSIVVLRDTITFVSEKNVSAQFNITSSCRKKNESYISTNQHLPHLFSKPIFKSRRENFTPRNSVRSLPILQFFHQHEKAALTYHSKAPTFCFNPSWKLSLYSLEQTLQRQYQKPDEFRLNTKKQYHEELFCPVFDNKSRDIILPVYRSVVTNSKILSFQKSPLFFSHNQRSSSKKQHKSPSLTYGYDALLRDRGMFGNRSGNLVEYPTFPSLLEAATRAWIELVQKNPFGKVNILLNKSL